MFQMDVHKNSDNLFIKINIDVCCHLAKQKKSVAVIYCVVVHKIVSCCFWDDWNFSQIVRRVPLVGIILMAILVLILVRLLLDVMVFHSIKSLSSSCLQTQWKYKFLKKVNSFKHFIDPCFFSRPHIHVSTNEAFLVFVFV